MDPVAFRRQNIDPTVVLGARWLSVMDAVTEAAGWVPKVANSVKQTATTRTGRGFGFGTYASSQVALVAGRPGQRQDRQAGRHARLDSLQNNGITVNLEGVGNQMSGALIMGLSRAMWEAPSWTADA